MIIIPLGLARELMGRPLISVILGILTIYHMLLALYFPSLTVNVEGLLTRPLEDWTLWRDLLLGSISGQGPSMAIFLAIFWLLLGPVLEEQAGKTRLILCYLAGAIIPFLLARTEVIAWERNYWPGLGSFLACLGLAYYYIWDEDIKTFTFVIFALQANYTNTSSVFFIGFWNLMLALSQYVAYNTRKGDIVPAGIGNEWWVLVFPFATLGLFLLAGKVLRQLSSGDHDLMSD